MKKQASAAARGAETGNVVVGIGAHGSGSFRRELGLGGVGHEAVEDHAWGGVRGLRHLCDGNASGGEGKGVEADGSLPRDEVHPAGGTLGSIGLWLHRENA